jgi:sugar lactone lactonase YvrE
MNGSNTLLASIIAGILLTGCLSGSGSSATSSTSGSGSGSGSSSGSTGSGSTGGTGSTGSGTSTTSTALGAQMGGERLAGQLNLTGQVSSYPFVSMSSCAGGPLDGNVLGSSISAPAFCRPNALTTDGINLYVVDNWLLQPAYAVIRKIDLTTGTTTSIAGSWTWKQFGPSGVSFDVPLGITTDGTSLYLADTGNQVIRKIDIATNTVTTFAGAVPATVGGAGSFADGAPTIVRFNKPSGITTDGVSLFVADTLNRAIRQINIATGVTSTLAGNPTGVAAIGDGTGAMATFLSPTAITTDGTNLYVVDANAVRQIGIASGTVVTIAGSATAGFVNSTGTLAKFNLPNAIATDGTNLYLTDNARVRQIVISTGAVTTLAGGGTGIQVDGLGAIASFAGIWTGTYPYGITSDGSKLYVGDSQAIRKIQ